MFAPLLAVLLCAQQPTFDDLRRALDAQDDEAVLEQLGTIRGAKLEADDRVRTARFLLEAAQGVPRLSMALELGGLAVALDETAEGRLFLARQEIRASEYAAAARHLDRALRSLRNTAKRWASAPGSRRNSPILSGRRRFTNG